MLPNDFKSRMRKLLKDEYDEFEKSYLDKKIQGLRVNTLKIDVEEFKKISPFNLMGSVPWEENGFYIDEEKPGKHPYHSAGLYYVQEPSAMAVVSSLNINKGDYVLDLCSAPGGKSTQAAQCLQGEGLLVSNEIDGKRAKILSENIERLGIENAFVTNNSPKELEKFFPYYFDKIIVDAPCSGEGMFRKDEKAALEWRSDSPYGCSLRQTEILNSAKKMLKNGGYIVYSTCTFSLEENEEIINRFVKENNDFEIIEIKKFNGFIDGFGDYVDNFELNKAVRLFPHKIKGEGHFLCLLRRISGPEADVKELKTNVKKDEIKLFNEFSKNNLNIDLNGNYFIFGDNLFKLPYNICDIKGLKVVRSGLNMGTFKKDRFEPSHSLALNLKKEEAKRVVDFTSNGKEIVDYLKGLTVEVKCEDGWTLVCVDGYSIGWGKVSKGILKNHYPKGLRWLK